MTARTMFDKIWDSHVVAEEEGEILLYVDRALIHEGSSHAFAALKRRNQSVARPHQVFAFTDHYVPTTGREKGRTGTVVSVLEDRVVVENVNMVKKHVKGNPRSGEAGGILDQESPIQISNVMLFNPHTQKGDRVGFKTLEDDRKVRYFKSNGEVVDV